MGFITITVFGVVLLVTASVAFVIKQYAKVKKKNQEIDALKKTLFQYEQTYGFEDCDMQIIDKCRNYLDTKFGNNIVNSFARYETMESKKQFMTKVVHDLAQCMDVDVNKIDYQDLGLHTRGCTYTEEDKVNIVLNEALLVADPEQLLKTTCHELRHCIQFQSITNNKWGFSPQRVAQWLLNWREYEPGDSIESFDSYQLQLVEVDARKFVEAVFNS